VSAAARLSALLAASLALAACSQGSASLAPNGALPSPSVGTLPQSTLRIVGIGDSLTAGVQSGALTGFATPGGASAGAAGTTLTRPSTQDHGFFALLYTQANPGVNVSDPATSPLPLVKPPGIGEVLAPTTSGFPVQISDNCDQFQAAANQLSTALTLRANPSSTPLDLAVPSATTHEALYMTGPTGECAVAQNPSVFPSSIVGLNALVNGESQAYGPVLAGFGPNVTQVSAAVALHPQVATIWLGHNELLKFVFSLGQSPAIAPQSIHDDLVAMIRQLQGAGAKVVVGDLLNVLQAGAFIPQPGYAAQLAATLVAQKVPPAQANAIAQQYAAAEIAQTGLGANGYFTIDAYFSTLAAIQTQQPPPTIAASQTVPDALAAHVTALNQGYNAAIAQAASETGVALADITTVYATIVQNGGIPITPTCCKPAYGGGLWSLDGLHLSDTGYALVAKTFIDALNAKYGLGIAPIDARIAAISAKDPYAQGAPFTPNIR
jgi:lysophospholipase L1-like esterase